MSDMLVPYSLLHTTTTKSLDSWTSVIPLGVASLWVMASNKQAIDAYGKVEFSNLAGLKRFNIDRLLISDQAVANLMVTSGSAVAEVLYLANEGGRDVSWSEVCSHCRRFCRRMRMSLASHFVPLVCFIIFSPISASRVFSKYEAPSVISKEVGEEGE